MSIRKAIFIGVVLALLLAAGVFCYFFVGSAPQAEHIIWGVDFSQQQAQDLGLDWKATYEAILSDLKAKQVKIGISWGMVEPARDIFSFQNIDWQMAKLQEYKAQGILVVGMKTPRWPECHIPHWAQGLPKENQQREILAMLRVIVLRYKDSPALSMWQVENEPFLAFGECPWSDEKFFQQEVSLVRSLDPNHRILVSESGEGSFWTKAGQYGDVVGTTIYRKVWVPQLNIYFTYPLRPVFYWRKAQIIHALFGKEVIGVELQEEPWTSKFLADVPLNEQRKTMNIGQFKKNIEFAKETGFKEHYLWGAEWWYWMKEKQHDPAIWEEAAELFLDNNLK